MGSSWVKRKMITWTAVLMIALLAVFFVIPSASALSDEEEEASTISAQGLLDMLDNVFGAESTTIDMGRTSTVSFSSGRLAEIYNDSLVSTAEDVIKGLGYVAVFIIFIIMCIQEASRGEMNEESWLKLFVIYLGGMLMVMYAGEIFDAIYTIGMYIISSMRSSTIASYELTGEIFDGFAWWVRVIGRICLWACKFSIVIPAWMIFYELVIRRMFAPLAVADCIAEGTHSPGIRYMKNFFGMFLRIAICYVIVALMGIFLNTIDNTQGDGWFFQLLSVVGITFGGSGLMMKTQSLVREIVGG